MGMVSPNYPDVLETDKTSVRYTGLSYDVLTNGVLVSTVDTSRIENVVNLGYDQLATMKSELATKVALYQAKFSS